MPQIRKRKTVARAAFRSNGRERWDDKSAKKKFNIYYSLTVLNKMPRVALNILDRCIIPFDLCKRRSNNENDGVFDCRIFRCRGCYDEEANAGLLQHRERTYS